MTEDGFERHRLMVSAILKKGGRVNVEDLARAWLEELWEQDGRRLGVPQEFPGLLAEAIQVMPPLHGNPDDVQDRQA